MALQTDDTDSSSNYEHELTFILSLPALHSPVSLVINDNTLQTDDTNSIIGFNIDVGSTTLAHSDTDVPQIITAPATLPSASVAGQHSSRLFPLSTHLFL
jgi:hypothetical protein